MKDTSELKAGVVGLGMIGGGIAVSLARRGRIPAVYDIRADVSEKLEGVPKILKSPAEVAKESDVIMVCVVNAEQALTVINGPDGLLSAAHEGMIVCLVSTVALETVRELAAHCEAKSVGFMDCGVTPGNLAAQNGMVAIVGGNDEVVRRALPVLEDWAKKVVRCGPVGAGMATKLARNVITYGGWRIVKEAQHLAEAANVDPQKLIEVIESADPEGKMLLSKLRQNDGSGKVPRKSAEINLPLMAKDLNAAHEMAMTLAVPMPATDMVRRNILDTLDMDEPVISKEADARKRGAEMANAVYGKGFGDRMAAGNAGNLYNDHTLEQLFANVWSRPGLPVRDRRLLVMGVTAALGRGDLVKIQAKGALENGEFTPDQLNEMVLQLAYYVGWCNAGSIAKGVAEAIREQTD